MNAGAVSATCSFLLFLHADVIIDRPCLEELRSITSDDKVMWGWFSFRLKSPRSAYRIIEVISNWRNRVTGIALGDHGIFVRADLFRKIGGFADINLMEDIELSRRLKSVMRGVEIKTPVNISVRRFENEGIVYTLFRMWFLRMLYYLGVNTDTLTRYYTAGR